MAASLSTCPDMADMIPSGAELSGTQGGGDQAAGTMAAVTQT